MIRKNFLFGKLIRIKTSSKDLFESHMTSFRPELEICPICGANGKCHIHAYYERGIVDFIKGKPLRHKLIIHRFMCDSCSHTHAILPDYIIPYKSYGLFFILRVLAEAFARIYTTERLCERFLITMNQLCKWKALFKNHKQEWLGILGSMEISDQAFMKTITYGMDYANFARAFTLKTAFSFLQSHKNPILKSPKNGKFRPPPHPRLDRFLRDHTT